MPFEQGADLACYGRRGMNLGEARCRDFRSLVQAD